VHPSFGGDLVKKKDKINKRISIMKKKFGKVCRKCKADLEILKADWMGNVKQFSGICKECGEENFFIFDLRKKKNIEDNIFSWKNFTKNERNLKEEDWEKLNNFYQGKGLE